jgi:hypothetical protein
MHTQKFHLSALKHNCPEGQDVCFKHLQTNRRHELTEIDPPVLHYWIGASAFLFIEDVLRNVHLTPVSSLDRFISVCHTPTIPSSGSPDYVYIKMELPSRWFLLANVEQTHLYAMKAPLRADSNLLLCTQRRNTTKQRKCRSR